MGKGSARRPSQVSRETVSVNWDNAMCECNKTTDCCSAEILLHPKDIPWSCTRKRGHTGDHVACGGKNYHNLFSWPQETKLALPPEWQTGVGIDASTVFAYNRANPKKKEEKNV